MAKAFVALESTVFCHGLPEPVNLEVAFALEQIVRRSGAEPRTVGILDGEVIAGLSEAQIRALANGTGVRKASLRDLPVVIARRQSAATTVASTMWIANRLGIPVFATGGIGGVHRSAGGSSKAGLDVSADLEALATVPMVVVCAGAKSVLDLPATREMLETRGVTVVGYGTDEMPAFFSRTSGLPVDVRCDSPREVAELVRVRWRLGLPSATLVTVPCPEESAIPASEIEPAIDEALREAEAQRMQYAAVTPFLLSRVAQITGNRSLQANVALLKNNARIAAEISRALANPLRMA